MRYRAAERGIALVLVLSILVLISILVLAILASVGNYSQVSRVTTNDSTTRALVDDCSQIVVGQIRDATTLDQTKSWSSQPGMIRTYSTAGTQSNLYKLYSSPNLVLDGTQSSNQGTSLLTTLANDLPQNWDKEPDLYTDLNSPVYASDNSTLEFPIVDPRAWSNPSVPPAPIPTGSWTGTGTTDVQGFSYSTALVGQGYNVDQVTPPTTTSDSNARLPMPVQWLYVRKNGFICAATDNGNGTASVPQDQSYVDPIANDPNPNPNPIIGRIAFWTDDETCKVNINTACGDLWSPETYPWSSNASITDTTANPGNGVDGANTPSLGANFLTPGSFWGVPRFATWYDEWILSPQSPLAHEFQRYAGHPSSVYLSAVFPQFSNVGGSASATVSNSSGSSVSTTYRDLLYSIVPRVNGGFANPTANPTPNTEGGTQMPSQAQSNSGSNYNLIPKHDRLYASIDELLYTPTVTSGTRNPNTGTPSIITQTALQKAKFFITANSKAPELNLFNLPRVSMWPINSDYGTNNPVKNNTSSLYCTPIDNLIASCSSLGSNYYFFQRSNANSATSDYSTITRNQTVYAYLQYLLGQKVPGYGSSLGSKYNTSKADQAGNSILESNQILTEVLDYIRCTNLQDPLLSTSNQFAPTTGMVVPLKLASNNTMGFGRFMTISEVGLQFIPVAPSGTITVGGGLHGTKTYAPPQAAAVLLLEGHAISSTMPFLSINGLSVSISGLNQTFQVSSGTITSQFSFPAASSGTFSFSKVIPIEGGDSVMAPSYQGRSNFASASTPPTQVLGNLVDFYGGIQKLSNPTATFLSGTDATNPAHSLYSYNPTGYPWVSTSTSNPTPSTETTFSLDSTGTGAGGLGTFTLTAPGAKGLAGNTQPIAISVYQGSTLVQTITVDLSQLNGTWVTPVCPTTSTGTGASYYYRYYDGTIAGLNGPAGTSNIIDAVRTMVPGYPQWQSGESHAGGDYRLIAGMMNPPSSLWVPEGSGDPRNPTPVALAHNFTLPTLQALPPSGSPITGSGTATMPTAAQGYDYGTLINSYEYPTVSSWDPGTIGWGDVPKSYPGDTDPWQTELTHDFDQGAGVTSDGAFINHPEESCIINLGGKSGHSPYFQGFYSQAFGLTTSGSVTLNEFASPNRLIPSPGMLGSLPTGLVEGKPWQTLLFRPQPEHPEAAVGNGGSSVVNTPPFTTPPDHLFLDLFWMPVAEPYAISETFATAGKINMNYQIVPFTYIDRATAMQAVLRSQRITAIPSDENGFYKAQFPDHSILAASNPRMDFRHDINLSTTNGGTLMQFENKFKSGDIFRSASQICDVYLVPLPTTWMPTPTNGFGAGSNSVDTDAYNWWNTSTLPAASTGSITEPYQSDGKTLLTGFKLTGDNSREQPYTNIYSLLTTKSNSFTVHMRVQSLQQAKTAGRNYVTDSWSDPASGGTDIITGEYRGSALIERYLDPSDPNVTSTDFATAAVNSTSTSLSSYYKYRVSSVKQFAP